MLNQEKIIRNGFEAVTRDTVEHESMMAMEAFERLQTICNAIKRIAGKENNEIADLAQMGSYIASSSHNDVDVLRECAVKAGVVGELVGGSVSHG